MNRGTLLFLVAAMLFLAVGCKTSQSAGAFATVEMKSLEDGTVTVGDYRGKVVLVNFWAPFVAKERYEVNGQKQAMNYPIVVGNEKVAAKFGGLLGYPTSVLISRDGRVLKRTTGLIDYEATTKMIEGAL